MSLEHSPVRGGREGRSDPNQLLRAHQIAELLGIHTVTVWRWAKKGKFGKAVKLSSRVTAWRAGNVEALINTSEEG